MNRLLREIALVCEECRFEKKWLIAPSLRVAQQWLEAIARAGRGIVNCRPQTTHGLALELASARMAREGLSLTSRQAGGVLIDRIWNQQRGDRRGYLFSLEPSPSLTQTMHIAAESLRMANVSPDELGCDQFEVAAKGAELAVVLERYVQALREDGLTDHAGVLSMAIQRLREDAGALGEDVLVLLPGDTDLVGLEADLIAAIPAENTRDLLVDVPLEPIQDQEQTDAALLRWLPSPADAPAPAGDGTVRICHAIGEVNEVRNAIRQCMARGCPLDDVELLYAEADTYIPLIYELIERLGADGKEADTFGVTFADGVPVRYSRPGRALTAWLEWTRQDYPQRTLVRMLQDGLLELPKWPNDPGLSFTRLATWLSGVGIVFGRDRYLPFLDDQIVGLQERVGRAEIPDEDGEVNSDRMMRTRARLQGMEFLHELVGGLMAVCPTDADSEQAILRKSVQFLETCARSVNELDNFAGRRLAEQITEMADLIADDDTETSLDAAEYLASLVGRLRVAGSGPRPGCLHVAHVLAGGHSGRGNTFIVGLDDHRFPGAGLQDPVLLDSERESLSPSLRTSANALRLKIDSFARLLARLRGSITLSFPSRDLAEDRELFPSRVILDAFRILSNRPNADQRDLMDWLAAPASFAPTDEAECLDGNEWWLCTMCGPTAVDRPREVIGQAFAHLGRGMAAIEARASERFTEFDGCVPQAGRDLDPTSADGPVLSASGLELLGSCPLKYFFRYVLRIEAPDDLVIDPNVWLDAMLFGSLLHEVFCRFLRQLRADGQLPPTVKAHGKLFREILDECVAKYRRIYPPPNENAYRRQYGELVQAGEIFMAEEERFCKDHWPEFFEAAIGLWSEGEGTEMDSPDPAMFPLPNGTQIRLRGRIDRIDRDGSARTPKFSVWDYKSGSTWKFRRDPPFWQGRVLQHAAYLRMAEDRLRQLDPKSVVTEVGYFFPAVRGQGERKAYSPDQLRGAGEIIQNLCRTVANGAFIATDNADDCGFCDYAPICGDTKACAEASKRKLSGDRIDSLAPFRHVRGWDE